MRTTYDRRALLMSSAACFLASTLMPSLAVAQAATDEEGGDEAPFGLRWGMSTEEVRSLGISLQQDQTTRGLGAIFAASKLPKMISDVEFVSVNFGFNDKLVKVSAASKTFANDPYGRAAKQRYSELVAVLETRYGKGESHYDHDDSFTKPNDFVFQLKTGHGAYYTNFKTSNVKVQIGLRGTDLNSAIYVLFYEYLPLLKQYETDRRTQEKDAL